MLQKIISYVVVTTVMVILLSSTASIGVRADNGIDEKGIKLTKRRRRQQRNKKKRDLEGNNVIDNSGRDARVENAILYLGPILPINQRKLAVSKGESGPGGVSDVLSGLNKMSAQTRKPVEKKLPYKCGVIFYDQHIPGEGGDALNDWIKKLVNSNKGATFLSSEEQESKDAFVTEVEEQIESVGPKDWKVIHSHGNGLALATDENLLNSWRDTVEKQNCHFVAAALFSDPLDHSIKLTKSLFATCKCSMEKFKDIIMGQDVAEQWQGQLDSFLFNYERHGSEVEMKDKVKKGLKLLKEHFEVVMVEGKGNFAEEILRLTGWKPRGQVKEASVSDGGLIYSKDLVSKFGKMSVKNGDADFIDAVSHVYHNSLDFLMMQ